MKLIIAGGRDFSDYGLLKSSVDRIIPIGANGVEIVSGCARGADALGELYAKENSVPVKKFPADWDKHGKSAGYIRNAQMAEYATHCICFWDGESKGTKMMIELAKKKGIRCDIIKY